MIRSAWSEAVLLGLLGVVVLAVLAGAIAVVALPADASLQQQRTELDENTALYDDATVETFEAEQAVTVQPAQLDMSISVAEDGADVNLDGLRVDSNSVYLRVDYREDISREVRFYVPADYLRPRVKRGLEATEGTTTANLQPVNGREATAVTIQFDGAETAVFELSKEAGIVSEWRSWSRDKLSQGTSRDLPRLSTAASWQRVGDEWSDDATVALGADASVQFDASGPETEGQRWITIPPCVEQTDPVCVLERDDSVFVVSATNDPPAVRYRDGSPGVRGRIAVAVADARQAVDKLLDDIGAPVEGLL